MKSDVTALGFVLLLIVIFVIFPPSLVEGRWSLTPRIYVEGQYDDNIFLTERNEQDDFITTISPGVNLAYEAPTGEISLDYEFQRVLYDDFSELDYSGHRGRAEASKDFTSWFGAGIREIFIRSQDPIELTGVPTFERPSIRRGRNRYTRNIVEPEAILRFGENRSIRVAYRNNILRNDRENIADQDGNAINGLFTFRINIHNGFELFYEHINQEYGETVPPTPDDDFDGDEIRGRYTYYFDPRTSAFIEYRYFRKDVDRERARFFDYEVHTPSIGFSHQIHENVSLSASGGYSWRDAEDEDDEEDTFYGRGDLVVRYKQLTVDLYAETGFADDFFSAETLGFNEFWRAGFNGSYQLLERLWIDGYFYFERDEFKDRDRTDKIWYARGALRYQLLRWLFLALEYRYNERDSNIPFESYDDNRFLGRIIAQYDIAERFQ